MHRLYTKLRNYAAAGREMGRSGSTVGRHINIIGIPQIVRHTFSEVVREGVKTK